MKILLILALLMTGLALGCRAAEDAVGEVREESSAARATREAGYTPTPAPRAERLAELPTATPEPTPLADKKVLTCVGPEPCIIPLATPTRGPGICYRTPAVQDWIIALLQIPSCAVISEAELYRITDPVGFTGLKAGDLSGLVNVDALVLADGHCGDWTDPEYAAAILDGFNPEAALRIDSQIILAGVPWPEGEVITASMHGPEGVESAGRIAFSNGIQPEREGSLIKRGQTLKRQVNTQARAIASAIAEARGLARPVIRVKTLGHAVIGNPPEAGSVAVYVHVAIPDHHSIIECQEG